MNLLERLTFRMVRPKVDSALLRMYEDRKIDSKALHELTHWTYQVSRIIPDCSFNQGDS